jgi:transcriptional antiterminator RfaH
VRRYGWTQWYLGKPLGVSTPDRAGFEALYPKILKKIKGAKGRFDTRPLFPTYLFVRFAIEQLRTVRYTRGVARVISFGPEPQEVGQEIIDAVRCRMDENGFVELVKRTVEWKRGERIKIGDGPFAGLDAIFLEELPDRERVVLLLEAVSSSGDPEQGSHRVIGNTDAESGMGTEEQQWFLLYNASFGTAVRLCHRSPGCRVRTLSHPHGR